MLDTSEDGGGDKERHNNKRSKSPTVLVTMATLTQGSHWQLDLVALVTRIETESGFHSKLVHL